MEPNTKVRTRIFDVSFLAIVVIAFLETKCISLLHDIANPSESQSNKWLRRGSGFEMSSVNAIQALNIPERELEFIRLLNTHNVRYLVIGGYAVRYHGCLRPASDLDVLVDRSAENSKRLRDAVIELLGYEPKFTVEELARPKKQISLKQQDYRIDVLTSIEGLNFDNAYDQRITERIAELPVSMISKQHLVESKKLSPREQDLQDVFSLASSAAFSPEYLCSVVLILPGVYEPLPSHLPTPI